jgi:hypothetical protein
MSKEIEFCCDGLQHDSCFGFEYLLVKKMTTYDFQILSAVMTHCGIVIDSIRR